MIWEIDDRAPEVEGLDAHGRPDPAYAEALGLRPAGRGARVLAALIEWTVAVIIALPALIALTPVLVQAASGRFDAEEFFAREDLVWLIVAAAVSQGLMIAYLVVQLVLHGRKGVTLGKAICGIRSVNVRTLERPGFWRGAVVRYLVAYASLLVPLIGPVLVIMLSPLFDIERRGRGWLDLAAATWFVDVRGGLNPYDQKRMRIARKRVKTPEHEEKAPLPSLATPVHRDAPAEYVPSARLSGGVIGAHRSAAGPAPERPETPAPGSLVSSTPPSLATGTAPPASFAPPAPAPAPAASPAPVMPPAPAPAAQPVPAPEPPVPAPAAVPADVPAVPADAPNVPVGVRAILVLDTGERVEVRGTTLFGRSPSAAAGEGEALLVPVVDDTRSVSKTHIAVMPARRGVFIVDRASTNGSAIVRDGVETALAAGHPAELRTGDTVRFGDRFLQVEWV
ncbi:RDD family protein [Microbacterium aurugineum]|uniref:RDD family protein n=1 Tax=Microbacterium aurugineum TaxID=2851642 RepID=A0ABY4J4F9_9MICO|nr:RDD family protein [Microbacterium aurugineum]UPL18866.1 RDD family protein [Microbacterium aurugineum]